jgi:CRISPR/Cas system Type II protein with McrA/HNH and RuvC-like nuclease domain
MRFAFDLGFSSIGYAVDKKYTKIENNLPVWAGVWLFDNENNKSELNEIKRNKRTTTHKKNRLRQVRKLLNIKLNNEFINKTKNIWKYIKNSKKEPLSKEEFKVILYHFAKQRGYIDMKKIFTNSNDNKENGVIKEAISNLQAKQGNNIFEKLLSYRDELIAIAMDNLVNKFNVDKQEAKEFLECYMPYRNNTLQKSFLNKVNETFKLEIKNVSDLFGAELSYFFILPNKEIANAIKDIYQFQKEKFNNKLLNEDVINEYIEIITYKGKTQSLEDKIGWCESGEKYKRSSKNTLDNEKFRIMDLWKNLICITKDNKEFFVKECLTFEEFYQRVVNTNKDKITRAEMKKILKDLKIKDFKQTNKIFLHLKAHCFYNELENKKVLEDEIFRDKVEYTLSFYSDNNNRKEKLKEHFNENDLKKIIEYDIGKPTNYSNIVIRDIIKLLEEKELTDIINEYKAKNFKFLNRSYLDFKEWKRNSQYNNPYLENIVKNFIKLFNHLVQNFGTPDEIVIESTRDFSISEREIKEKDNQLRKQKQNEETNNMIREFLDKKFTTKPKNYGSLIRKLKLFLEQNKELKKLKDNSVAFCPITGEIITIEDALDETKTNIDHIIPQSVMINNSLNNTMLISAKINQKEKQDMTPVEYIMNSKNVPLEVAKEMLKENLKKTKIKDKKFANFFIEKAENFKYDFKGFDLRHLQSTHFGVKEIKELLIRQYHFNNPELSYHQKASKVLFTNGKLTSILRRVFIPKYHKNRKYYINHLIDALILLNIDRSMQQYIHTLANKYKEKEIYKQKEFLNYLREEYFEKKEIKTKFDTKEAIKFFEEKFNNLELGAYKEEVKLIKKRYLKDIIIPKKELEKKKSAIKTKSGYRTKDKGFKKIYVCKDNKNKLKAVFENYFDKKTIINKKLQDLEIIDVLYRYSLVEIKDKIAYIVGGVESNNQIEIIPVNKEKEKQIQIITSKFKRKNIIIPLGVIK